jgi:hypothetical protein
MATQSQQTACTHRDRELLGWDHDLAFGRCTACGAILLKQQGELWAVTARPQRDAANDDADRAVAANDDVPGA